MTTFNFKNVYVKSESVIVGNTEKDGPFGDLFEDYSRDPYFGKSSFELGEIEMTRLAISKCLQKGKIKQADVAYGTDLMNQLTCHYLASELNCSFTGLYGACSGSALVIGHGAMMLEYGSVHNVLCFASSHAQTAERQFRYPNEYGIQKKECSTTTVTACGAVVLSNEFSDLKITSFTMGKVIDWQFKDVHDMGKAMVPAAYQTMMDHFYDTKRTFDDYDLVLTGDLGKIGYAMLSEMMEKERFQLHQKLNDCGILIYDINHQDVYCGGSGCGCSMAVLLTHVFSKLRTKEMKRVLLVATGCLHNVFLTQQNQSIPVVAHAICIERS